MTGWLTWDRKGGTMITEKMDRSPGLSLDSGDEHKPSGVRRRAFVLDIGSCHRESGKHRTTRGDG